MDHQTTTYDTAFLGKMVSVETPGPTHSDVYRCVFDTGAVLYVPKEMFLKLVFHLQDET